jgi:hypothetical protein
LLISFELKCTFWSKEDDLFLQEMAKIKTVTSSGQSQAEYEQTKIGE